MPIRTPEAPRRSVAVVETTLARLLAEPQFLRQAKLVAPIDEQPLSLSTPHHVFAVEVEQLRRQGLEHAEPTSVRFIVLQGDNTLGSAETRLEQGGRPGPFANVARAPRSRASSTGSPVPNTSARSNRRTSSCGPCGSTSCTSMPSGYEASRAAT